MIFTLEFSAKHNHAPCRILPRTFFFEDFLFSTECWQLNEAEEDEKILKKEMEERQDNDKRSFNYFLLDPR